MKNMRPEILLKAYVLHQSDGAFRELVAGSLDEVYSTALRIIHGPEHLVEETVLRAYWELARKAPRLGEGVAINSWLREHICKMAVIVLREEDRAIDRTALKREKQGLSTANGVQPAPPGLATRVSQGILLNLGRRKHFRMVWWPVWRVEWTRRARIGAVVFCGFIVIMVLWNIPFHKRNPIVESPDLQMTPASFAQLASPEEGAVRVEPIPTASTNAQANSKQQ